MKKLKLSALLLSAVMAFSVIPALPVQAAASYKLLAPNGLYVRAGVLYALDGGSNVIYKLSSKGNTSLYIGSDEIKDKHGYAVDQYLDGTYKHSLFAEPYDAASYTAIAVNKKTKVETSIPGIAISDTNNHVIRFAANKYIQTASGTGKAGYADGFGVEAQFNGPKGLAVDASGDLYIADCYNNVIRRMDQYGNVTTVIGSVQGGNKDGYGTDALLREPSGICIEGDYMYIADTGNHAIKRVNMNTFKVETIAGTGYSIYSDSEDAVLKGDYVDGSVAEARFDRPEGICVKDGAVYVADTGNSAIRRIANYKVSTIDVLEGEEDVAPQRPVGIAFLGDSLYVADRFTGEVYALGRSKWLAPEPTLKSGNRTLKLNKTLGTQASETGKNVKTYYKFKAEKSGTVTLSFNFINKSNLTSAAANVTLCNSKKKATTTTMKATTDQISNKLKFKVKAGKTYYIRIAAKEAYKIKAVQ